MNSSRTLGRIVLSLALGVAAATLPSLVAPSEAMAQTTTRPEFMVGLAITAKVNHTLPGIPQPIKIGMVGKVTRVYSSNAKPVYVDIHIAGGKAVKVPVATVRTNYNYPKP